MSTNSKLGKIHVTADFMKALPDSMLLIEAAVRRGQPLSELVRPMTPNQAKIKLQDWKNAKAAAMNSENPDMNPMYVIYDDVQIDLLLSSMIQTRILRVQQAKFNWVDANKKPNEEIKKFFERQWFLDFQKFAVQSIFESTKLIELFELDENGELKECKCVNKYHVKAKKGIVTKEAYDETGTDYLNGPIALYYIPVGDPNELGLLFKVVPIVLAIKYAIGQWNAFNQKMGIPFRTITTNAADAKRQQQLGIIMEDMGASGWAVINEGEKVELLEMAGTNPTQCFKELINLLDARIATYIMGQSATSNPANNKGTYGSMAILQEISDVLHESDLTMLKYLINDKLKKRLPLISPVYKPIAGLDFEWDKSVDLSVKEIVDYVVSLSGVFEVDPKFVSEKTGIPINGLKKQPVNTPPPAVPKKKSPVTADLKEFYNVTCCGVPNIVAAALPSFDDDVLRIAKAIFEGKQKGIVDIDLLNKTARYLQQGIKTGYGKPTDTTDKTMIKSLMDNVQVFSGYKTYQQLKDIGGLLKDEKGNVRDWPDFKKEVLKNNSEYNVNFLKAEYDNALVGAQMSSYWQEIQRNKETLPYLKFVATNDNRTTEICKRLDGFIAPVDDPIWKEYFLPLHWHERSNIIQLAVAKPSDKSKFNFPDLQEMFQGNIGISGTAFPKSHPYYEASLKDRRKVEEAIAVARIHEARTEVRDWAKKNVDELKGKSYKVMMPEFDVINIRRGDVKVITGKPHAQAAEAYQSIKDLPALFKGAVFMGSSPDAKKTNNYHQDVIEWLYYEVTIASEKSYLNIMQTGRGEFRLHSISDKQGFNKRKVKNKPKK